MPSPHRAPSTSDRHVYELLSRAVESAPDPDFFEALVYAALQRNGGDLDGAVRSAALAQRKQYEDMAEGDERHFGKVQTQGQSQRYQQARQQEQAHQKTITPDVSDEADDPSQEAIESARSGQSRRGSQPLLHPELHALDRAANDYQTEGGTPEQRREQERSRVFASHALADWLEENGQGHLTVDAMNPDSPNPRHFMASSNSSHLTQAEYQRLLWEVLGLTPEWLWHEKHANDPQQGGAGVTATLDPDDEEERRLGDYLSRKSSGVNLDWRPGGHPRNWSFGPYPEAEDFEDDIPESHNPSLRRLRNIFGNPAPVEKHAEDEGIDEPISTGAGVDKIGRHYAVVQGKRTSLKREGKDEEDHDWVPFDEEKPQEPGSGRKWVNARTGATCFSPHDPGSQEHRDFVERIGAIRRRFAEGGEGQPPRRGATTWGQTGGQSHSVDRPAAAAKPSPKPVGPAPGSPKTAATSSLRRKAQAFRRPHDVLEEVPEPQRQARPRAPLGNTDPTVGGGVRRVGGAATPAQELLGGLAGPAREQQPRGRFDTLKTQGRLEPNYRDERQIETVPMAAPGLSGPPRPAQPVGADLSRQPQQQAQTPQVGVDRTAKTKMAPPGSRMSAHNAARLDAKRITQELEANPQRFNPRVMRGVMGLLRNRSPKYLSQLIRSLGNEPARGASQRTLTDQVAFLIAHHGAQARASGGQRAIPQYSEAPFQFSEEYAEDDASPKRRLPRPPQGGDSVETPEGVSGLVGGGRVRPKGRYLVDHDYKDDAGRQHARYEGGSLKDLKSGRKFRGHAEEDEAPYGRHISGESAPEPPGVRDRREYGLDKMELDTHGMSMAQAKADRESGRRTADEIGEQAYGFRHLAKPSLDNSHISGRVKALRRGFNQRRNEIEGAPPAAENLAEEGDSQKSSRPFDRNSPAALAAVKDAGRLRRMQREEGKGGFLSESQLDTLSRQLRLTPQSYQRQLYASLGGTASVRNFRSAIISLLSSGGSAHAEGGLLDFAELSAASGDSGPVASRPEDVVSILTRRPRRRE